MISSIYTDALDVLTKKFDRLEIVGLLNTYIDKNATIVDQVRIKTIGKSSFLRYLKRSILNERNTILQFSTHIDDENGNVQNLKVHLVSKQCNGQLHFTELDLHENWREGKIVRLIYQSTQH